MYLVCVGVGLLVWRVRVSVRDCQPDSYPQPCGQLGIHVENPRANPQPHQNPTKTTQTPQTPHPALNTYFLGHQTRGHHKANRQTKRGTTGRTGAQPDGGTGTPEHDTRPRAKNQTHIANGTDIATSNTTHTPSTQHATQTHQNPNRQQHPTPTHTTSTSNTRHPHNQHQTQPLRPNTHPSPPPNADPFASVPACRLVSFVRLRRACYAELSTGCGWGCG